MTRGTERSDKERWPASRFLDGLLEHERTGGAGDFAAVPMLSKARVMALASGDAWLDTGETILIFGPADLAT